MTKSAGIGIIAIVFIISVVATQGNKSIAAEKSGGALFKEHCALCHPGGGNIVNPQKTLHKKDREAHNVLKESDIIHLMRNPGPGMTKFGPSAIPDHEAKKIAEYILKTFN